MKSRDKLTNYDKRKLTYERGSYVHEESRKTKHPLDLPPEFSGKIS